MNRFQHHPSQPSTYVHRKSRLMTGLAFSIAAALGLVASAFPGQPAIAATDSEGDFRRCAANLANLQLPSEEVVAACSRNLAPENLWKCVTQVARDGYTPVEALNACRVVRQPREMASCVGKIRRSLTDATAGDVLESCRRSLLPVRYSDCVVGVSRGESKTAPTLALASCNDEGEFPREIDPTFIPYADNRPVLPIPETQPITPPQVTQPAPAPATPATPVRALF